MPTSASSHLAALPARRPRRRVFILLGVVALLATFATPAAATIFESGRFGGDYVFTDTESCDFDLLIQGSDEGRYRIREGKTKVDTAFFFQGTTTFEETITNTSNGAFITVRGHFMHNETRAIPLGGSLFEFRDVEAGQISFYDADGSLLFRDRGMIQFTYTFDTGGDDVPGGTFGSVIDIRLRGPHPSWDVDWCGLFS